MQLGIQLGQRIRLVDRCISNVSDSCRLDNVSDNKLLDGLVFGDTSGTVRTSNILHVSSAMFRSSIVSSLRGLGKALRLLLLQSLDN